MNKKELTQSVYDELEDVTKKDAKEVISQTLDTIIETIGNGEDITIKQIGTFTTETVGSHMEEKENGEKVRVPTREQPALEPSSRSIDAINEEGDQG